MIMQPVEKHENLNHACTIRKQAVFRMEKNVSNADLCRNSASPM